MKNDNTLEKGLRKVIQAGVNGEILKITSYALANKETGELSSTTTEKVVKEMIKEVVLLGTKEVEKPKEEVKPEETKQEQPKEEVKPEESKEVEQPKEEVKPEEPKEVEQPKEEVKPEETKQEQPKEEVKPEETKEEQSKEAVQTEQPKEVEKIKDTSNKKQEKTVKSAKIAKIQKHKLYVGSKKLPNTGETSNSAMLIGLVSLAVAARLKQSKSK